MDRNPTKEGTLAWLEEVYFTQGREAAKTDFARHLPAQATRPYYLMKHGQGQPAQRTDTEVQDGISYESFDAPALWGLPYSILRVSFERVPKEDFIYHGGEEILLPISGEILYHFYSSDDGKRPRRHTLEEPLRKDSIIRINPQLPHHTWAANKDGAEAWMIFRHLSDIGTSISVNPRLSNKDMKPSARRATIEDLKEPGGYALRAWGLAERIYLHRVRSNLRIGQLAAASGLHSSHLSRIESARTNISLETVVRISRLLQINLDEIIAPNPWSYEVAPLVSSKSKGRPTFPLKKPPGPPHYIHPIYWHIPTGRSTEERVADSSLDGILSSWIVLDGQAIFEILSDSDARLEVVEKGSVLHLRGGAPTRIQALQDCGLLQIVYSAECFCRDNKEA